MISGHGGVKSEVEVKSSKDVVSTDWGEVFIGTTGKKILVMDVIREVTGMKAEGCRDDTLYTFLFDMCRTQTKGAPVSRIKDKKSWFLAPNTNRLFWLECSSSCRV